MSIEDRFKIPQSTPYGGNDLLDAQSFGSLLMEYARGNVNASEALSILNAWVQTSLTSGEQTDLNAIRSLIDAGATINSKVLIASKIKDVLILGERVTEGYTTRSELKSKIGF